MRVVPKRTLDFTSVSSGPNNVQEVVLAQGIDVSDWREISLMVRTHSNSITNSVGNIQIYAYLEGRTQEDPGILFATTTPQGTYTITASTPQQEYAVNALNANAGAMIKIVAKGTRVHSLTGNTIKADVSVDLSLKSA
jgi:hypothetical protein